VATLSRWKVAEISIAIILFFFTTDTVGRGRWTLGGQTCSWIAFITAQGDHRLRQVQTGPPPTGPPLKACLGKTVDLSLSGRPVAT